MDVQRLAHEWEKNGDLRDRARRERKMNIHPKSQTWCEPTRSNCVSNSMVLLPCLDRLKEHGSWKLPYLEPLQSEIATFHEKMGIPLEEKVIYTTSVEIKKMLGFIKRRVSRQEPTKDHKP